MKSVCVYCGASDGVDAVFFEAARELGRILAENNIRLIYGAGAVGLMGELAKSCLEAGGSVLGVIPRFMHEKGWSFSGVSELVVVETMHERKEMMAKLADAIVALPGGCGTFEELFEAITWKQLGLLSLPIVLLNQDNYYDSFLKTLDQAVEKNFMHQKHLNLWTTVACSEQVLSAIEMRNLQNNE